MNRKCKLTDVLVAGLVPDTVEYACRDTVIPNLSVRVHPTGGKRWVVRHQRETKRITLGDTTAMTVAVARKLAHEVLGGQIERDQLPLQAPPTFEEFAKRFVERRKPHLAASTHEKYDRRLRSILIPAFKDKRLDQISRADVTRWFGDFSQTAPGNANELLTQLRQMFYRACEWGDLPKTHPNPCVKVRRNRRPPRGQLLTMEELSRLGATLYEHERRSPTSVDAIRMLLLTGCRLSEVLTLQWVHVERRHLNLPRCKTGPRRIELGTPAVQLLARRRKTATSAYVFPSRSRPGQPLTCITSTWSRVRTKAQLSQSIRIHDLRHTYASHSVMAGETLFITGKMLGHRRSATTARYSHLIHECLAEAAQDIGSSIIRWVNFSLERNAGTPHFS